MQAGDFDTQIRIEQKVLGRDATTGAQTWSWTQFVSRWAKLEESAALDQGIEQVENSAVYLYQRPTRVRLRYVAGVTASMRVVRISDGRILQIIGVATIGRNELLRLTCRDFSVDNP